MGIKCDTEFESGREYSIEELYNEIKQYNCKNIIWTGGEPAQQLTDEIIEYFKNKGFYQCIETSGLFPVSELLDYIVVSPKVAEHVIKKNFNRVNELRYVRHKGQEIPSPSIEADNYFISPHSDGFTLNFENMKHCLNLVKANPKWRISIQMHKIYSVL